MSDIDILGTLAPNAGSTAPLTRAEYIRGSVLVVDDATARDAIPPALLRNKQIALLASTGAWYQWNGSSWGVYSGFGSSIVDWKDSVRFATTVALPASTLVGIVRTANANGAFPAVDGVTAQVGDRFLDKDHATGSARGYYAITSLGSGGTPWVVTRTADADTSAEVTSGMGTIVTEGTANGGKLFLLTTADPIVLGTTALTFTGLQTLTADGTTLTLSGGVLSITAGGVGATQLAVNAVTTGKILDGNVTAQKLSSLSITDIAPVAAATTGVLPTNTRTGNVLTASANGALPAQDGQTLTLNARLLVNHEATAANRGIYTVTAVGSGGTPWTLTRATDQDDASDFRQGAWFFIAAGTQHGGKLATLVTAGTITVNTTALNYALLPISSSDPLKGQSAIFNGTIWVLSGVATRAADLPDADVSIQVSEGSRFVLSPGTLTANRQCTILTTGAVDKELVLIERYDTTVFTYRVNNSLGSALYTFPASSKRMGSFQIQGDWGLQGTLQATGG